MNEKIKKPISPTRLIIGSFVLVILVGGILLSMPFSSKSGQFTAFIDSLFTATTATCVMGLITVDTFSRWSYFGQGIILALIQIGGLGLVTLTTFFMVALRKKAGLSSMALAREAVNGNDLSSLKRLVGLVIVFSFTVELIGAAVLAVRFVPELGSGEGIWVSVFTAISAYCNAGLDLFGRHGAFSSLTHYANDPLVILAVSSLIIIGGLGFIVYYDILFARKKRGHTMLHTRLVICATLIILILSTTLFFLFEFTNPKTIGVIDGAGNKVMAAGFHSVSLRTAGGVKVTTVVVIAAMLISTLRGADDVTVLGRKIDRKTVYKSISLVIIGLFVAAITTSVIYVCDGVNLIDSAFEAFSALGTTGVSTGITPSLSMASKITVIITMLLGRVGPFTFFIAFSGKNDKSKAVILPEGQIIVG